MLAHETSSMTFYSHFSLILQSAFADSPLFCPFSTDYHANTI
jgi:hypothetical protein